MSEDSRVDACRGEREDRISVLPKNVIYHILELLPTTDAARTSILSKKWRYTWAMLPCLVLDKHFCHMLTKKSQSNFKDTVDKILLQHLGGMVKFVLDVSGTHLSPFPDIDRWMLYVTRKGVKDLTLNFCNNSIYKLPSYIFNCPTLTHLELYNCTFKPPNRFLGFENLEALCLVGVNFVLTGELCVISAPLVKLTLIQCHGTQYPHIVSSHLESLVVSESHYLDLNCFTICEKLRVLVLELDQVVDQPKHDKRSTLEKLLFSSPTLEILHLGSAFLELLSADTFLEGPPFKLNCLWHLSLTVDFGELRQISCALYLISSIPSLSKLQISVSGTSDDAEAVLEHLNTPSCLHQLLDKLKDVCIHFFKGSKAELLFVKLLFARTPSLVTMSIERSEASGYDERNITTSLMRFSRASPEAELLYLPNMD